MLALLLFANVFLPIQPVFAAENDGTLQPVWCNIQGNSGTWRAQIAALPTEHEFPLLDAAGNQIVVHSQSEVTAEMDAQCVVQYGTVTPITPRQVVVCGANNDTITLFAQPSHVSLLDDTGWVNGVRTITYVADAGYMLSTQGTYVFIDTATECDPELKDATAVDGSFYDTCGVVFNLTFTPPPTEGVTYHIVQFGNTVTVTATAHAGYALTNPGWSQTATDLLEACKVPHILPCESDSSSTVAVDTQFADYQDTRTSGHYTFAPDSLHIWTDDATSQAKVAWYHTVDYPLLQIGAPSMSYTANSGVHPGLQVAVDFNNDGSVDGILVGETVYGNNWWLTNSAQQFAKDGAPHTGGGNGSLWYGTLDEWLASFPHAQVKSVGFSLGSGVLADGNLSSITFGCHTWYFGAEAPVPEPVAPTFTDATCQLMAAYAIPESALYGYTVQVGDGIEVPVDPGTYYLAGTSTITIRAYTYSDESFIERGSWDHTYRALADCTPGRGAVEPTPPRPTPLPIELPHTGPSDTIEPHGIYLSLLAALATYGAVYFSQRIYGQRISTTHSRH